MLFHVLLRRSLLYCPNNLFFSSLNFALYIRNRSADVNGIGRCDRIRQKKWL